jgi:polygalacturonase
MKALLIVLLGIGCCAVAYAQRYDVRAFGAMGDGATKDTAAIQRALDACAKTGGTVVVPPGTYLTGSIYLGDATELHLEAGATLLGSPDLADYNAPDAYPQNWGSVKEGWSAKHLILALERRNVSITGRGAIDGNGRAFFDDKPTYFGTRGWRLGAIGPRGARSEQRRPGQGIVFIECEGVAVQGVTLRDMPCWSCFFHGCAHVAVGGVTVRNGIRNLNTDGFDVDSCRHVRLGDCDIETGDDAIAIRGAPARLKDPSKVCEDVRVSNIVCRVSADGVRVGVGNGTIRNVRISNMEIRGAGRGLHVQCCYGSPKPGGKVGVDISDVTFENVTIRNATESICVMAGSPVANSTLRDILFRNVDAESYLSPVLIADGATYPENVRFDGCRFRLVKDPHPVKAEGR